MAVYRRVGVEKACLDLQDRLGADVNLLLFCCWLGREIEEGQLDRILAEVGPWQREVVEPLRAVRRGLKARLSRPGDPGEGAGDLREQIAASELEAERREQVLLESRVQGTGPGEPTVQCAIHNLKVYLSRLGNRVEEADSAALVTILAAAFPDEPIEVSSTAHFGDR